jgi:pimeloyl-ACP methyl ester carboxylesterase
MVGGWWILHTSTFIDDVDGTLLKAMSDGYAQMADDQGIVGSPWAATYLAMQSRDSFDMQVFDAKGSAALIFLHGFGGNFTMPCWEVAQAAKMANVATFCPSTEVRGRWWLGGSVEIIRQTIEYARSQGYEHIFLAGLSNGAIGLSRVAPRFADEVDGFVFLSGISAHANPTAAPTLVIHGDHDVMTRTAVARSYARRAPDAKYVRVSGGHFVLIEDRDVIRPTLADWLRVHAR